MTINYKFQQCLVLLRSLQIYCLFMCCFCPLPFVHTDSYDDLREISTLRGLYYTLRAPPNENIKNDSIIIRSNFHVVNKIKNHIKLVLNLEEQNSSIDEYIINSFNIYNPDPMYVFVLSENDSNRTVVLRRSNFSSITFPNITSLQRLHTLVKDSKLAQYLSDRLDHRTSKLTPKDVRFYAKLKQLVLDDDLDEAESLRIVEENVRTERNFFKFMDSLNDRDSNDELDESSRRKHKYTDYQSILKDIHSHDHLGNYKLINNAPHYESEAPTPDDQITWDDLGLPGWAGSIIAEHEHPQENRNPMRVELLNSAIKPPSIFPHKFIPILPNFDPLALLTSTTPIVPADNNDGNSPHSIHQFGFVTHQKPKPLYPTRRPKPPPMHSTTMQPNLITLFSPETSYLYNYHSNPAPLPSRPNRRPNQLDVEDTWDIKFNISDELRDLLKLEKGKLQSLTQSINSKPKFMVTQSRAKHKDDDVFVGRANNPFGHSTKWQIISNASYNNNNNIDDEEDRQKRDVIDLYSMVKCATGCDPIIYKGYGCYCGFLGKGRALDGIDRCCKMHDYCYQAANCPKFLEYFVPYLWKCYRGRPLCAIDHGEWGGPQSCAATLCECDKLLSQCLRRFYCPRKRAVCTSSPLRLLQNILMDI